MPDAEIGEWDLVLRAYSAALEEHRTLLILADAERLVDDAAVPPAAFTPSPTLPPLPDALVPWARQLVEQTNELIDVAERIVGRPAPAQPARARVANAPSRPMLDTLL